ncbi:MAG: hypothetical protein ACRDFW_12450 [bacterium]
MEEFVAGHLKPLAGAIPVPDQPGIGVDVREAALHELAVLARTVG